MKKFACIIFALLILASTAFAASGDGEGVPVLPGDVSAGEESSSSGALEITGEVAVPDAPAETGLAAFHGKIPPDSFEQFTLLYLIAQISQGQPGRPPCRTAPRVTCIVDALENR